MLRISLCVWLAGAVVVHLRLYNVQIPEPATQGYSLILSRVHIPNHIDRVLF